MTIPENACLTLASVAKKLDKHIDDIEEYLINGDMTPSIRRLEGLELYEVNLEFNEDIDDWDANRLHTQPEPAENGLYNIVNYENIRWDYNSKINMKTANLCDLNVYLRKENRAYSVAFAYLLKQDDLIVTSAELEQFIYNGNSSKVDAKEFAQEFIKTWLAAGKSKEWVIVELVEKHGSKKEKYYGTIARELFSYLPSDDNAVWRKRGLREYEKAKKSLSA